MTRALPILGWLTLAVFLAVVATADYVIVADLYRPPEGPWPGWMPLVEANVLYGGGGLLVAAAVRWAWRRRAPDHRSSIPLAKLGPWV